MASGIESPSICILGCGGFIGSHLVDRLLAETEWSLYGIDKVSAKIDHALSHPRMHFVSADVYDTPVVASYVRRCDIVVSLVALCNPALYNTIPVEVIETNFTHPVEVARLCAEHGKWLIHFSTSEVYGKTVDAVAGVEGGDDARRQLLSEEGTPLILGPVSAQRWSYACAKQLAERMIYAYGFQKGLEYTIVRPFNFIGPRMDYIPGIDGEGIPRVLACFLDALMRGKPLQLVNGGRARRTFTYIDDAVDAVMAILRNRENAAGRIFNVGNPSNEVTIAELAQMMIHTYGALYPDSGVHSVESVSGREFYGEGYDDSDRRMPDIRAAREQLGWQPRISLPSALRTTVEAYVEAYRERIRLQAAC
ncbi:MAG: bifunctional UDP-4-keto-pentose/UDP-xylose synthase [Chitinivibrionales bacterium]|nr:bifunctional UDP-4-keto-pentose/UDP-xylose synthase [Chitinivibrionales bacterium]